jgi:sugar-specific transcriptional regulator TrmB
VASAGIVFGAGPNDIVDPEEVAKDLREKNKERLKEYERKLRKWKEEESRKGPSGKVVWSSSSPVPR